MDKKFKTVFVCTQCGAIHPRWQGQCRECAAWNCLAEERLAGRTPRKTDKNSYRPISLEEVSLEKYHGFTCGIAEFDRVLGGSLLPGCSVLLAGEPGIGKSTLILQAAEAYSRQGVKVLYVTGEESPSQLKTRAGRLNLSGKDIFLINATAAEEIVAQIENGNFGMVVVDSIQTISCGYFDSLPGTVGQIRESAARLIEAARKNDISIFLVGHVTKEGLVAGPKVLEHLVDVVLQFEGDHQHLYRLLRPSKNRFGSTFELGVFEMSSAGLIPVDNPSSLFLSDTGRPARSGSVVAASCEGNRPILVEIQALVSSASYGTPQRVAGGIDNKRLALLLAILEKRIGLPMGQNDVFVSVAGGLKLSEPAIDLGIIAAIVSSLRDIPIDHLTVLAGEVGLSGEVRPISMADRRISEAAKLGFRKIVLPESNLKGLNSGNISVEGIANLEKALEIIF